MNLTHGQFMFIVVSGIVSFIAGGFMMAMYSDCVGDSKSIPWRLTRYAAYVLLSYPFVLAVSAMIKALLLIILN